MSHSPPSPSPRAMAAAVLVERPLLAVALAEKLPSPALCPPSPFHPSPPSPPATPGLVLASVNPSLPPSSTPSRPRTAAAAAVVVASWEPPTKRAKALHRPLHSTWMDLPPSTAAFEWTAGSHSPLSTCSSSSLSTASLSTASLPSYPVHPLMDRRSSLPSFSRVTSPFPVTPRRVSPRQSSAPLQSRSIIPAGTLANLHLRLQQHPAIQRIQQLGSEDEEEEEEEEEERQSEVVDHNDDAVDDPIKQESGWRDSPQEDREDGEAEKADLLPLAASYGRPTYSPSLVPQPYQGMEGMSSYHLRPYPLHLVPVSASSSLTRPSTLDTSGFVSGPLTTSHFPSSRFSSALSEEPQWDDYFPSTSPSLTDYSTSGSSDGSTSAGGEEEEHWQSWLDLEVKGQVRETHCDSVMHQHLYLY